MSLQLSTQEIPQNASIWARGGFDCTIGDNDLSYSVSGGSINVGGSIASSSYTVNTGTGSCGSSIACTCFTGTSVGAPSCPVHGGLTFVPTIPATQTFPAVSPNYTFWPAPPVEDKCYICRDQIEPGEMLAGHKTCRDCRKAVETFKAVLAIEEEKEK